MYSNLEVVEGGVMHRAFSNIYMAIIIQVHTVEEAIVILISNKTDFRSIYLGNHHDKFKNKMMMMMIIML